MSAKNSILQDQKGFTLIEMLIVALMLGLVMGAIHSLYKTTERTANVEDDLVDVRQNVRIAIDSIARDVIHSGFLISQLRNSQSNATLVPTLNGNSTCPINSVFSNDGNMPATFPTTSSDFSNQPSGVHADKLILNVASPFDVYARLNGPQTWLGTSMTFSVATPQSVDGFNVNDYVAIVNPIKRMEELSSQTVIGSGGGITLGVSASTVMQVTGTDRNGPSITLKYISGTSPVSTEFASGDIIAKVQNDTDPYPNTVSYCVGPSPNCAPNTTCPTYSPTDNTLCLMRIVNEFGPSGGVPEVIASRISGFQLSYLLDAGTIDSGTEVSVPVADLGAIRAVRIAITGQTAKAKALSISGSTTEKTSTMETVVKLRNRWTM